MPQVSEKYRDEAIIANPIRRITDAVRQISEVLKDHPTSNVVLYSRVSGPTQVTNGSLEQQSHSEFQRLRQLVGPGRVKAIVSVRELGKLSAKRSGLREAIQLAKRFRPAILCAKDLSRLIRPEDYNRRTNSGVRPSLDELERLLEIADGVPLATRLDPELTESDRHSLATRQNPNCGRPSSIPKRLIRPILEMLHFDGASQRIVAEQYGQSKGAVQRLWNLWRENPDPCWAYEMAAENGELSQNGRRRIESKG